MVWIDCEDNTRWRDIVERENEMKTSTESVLDAFANRKKMKISNSV